MVMEPGTLADARKAQEPIGWDIYGMDYRGAVFAPAGGPLARYLGLSGTDERAAMPVASAGVPAAVAEIEEAKAAQDALVVENPATCDHRADVLWLAHRLRTSEHRVADLTRQKKHLERRLRKALRGRRKH